MGARECQPGRAEGISALAHYVAMRYAQPLLSLGDSIHSIHLSTEFEAEIKFCDLVEAVNSHATLQARVEELTKALTEIDTLATCTGVVDPALHRNMLDNIYRIARRGLAISLEGRGGAT